MKRPTTVRFRAKAWGLLVLAATLALTLAVSAGAAVATEPPSVIRTRSRSTEPPKTTSSTVA